MSTKIEENVTQAFQQQAFDQARQDYEKYFEALEKHPRLLVGSEVPAIGAEGMETLKDSNDAKEWQEAVRSLLAEEIQEKARERMDQSRGYIDTIHASIDLFKNNKDLIPGTKQFDRQLADEFAKMAQPYEVRANGTLSGYSIPVQPIIDSIREKLKVSRTAAAPPEAATQNPSPQGSAPPAAAQSPGPPQAGIESKAGSSTENEDFSTLFGTIGLPHLQI